MSIFKQGHGQVGVQVVVRLKAEIRGAHLKSVITAHCPSVSTQVFSRRVPWKISWGAGGVGSHNLFEKILKHIHVPSAVVCDDIKSHIVE